MRILPAAALFASTALVAPGGLEGRVLQDPETYSQEELERLHAEAASAPLFASHDPLAFTLSTRVEFLREERPDEEELDGWVSWRRPDGSADSVDVEVRTRGNFRRQKRNCRFPPLRLDFPRSRVVGTVFETQDKLKLVLPCDDRREDYQHLVLVEYLAYRLYNLVTPVSYRVRLVEATLHDVDGEYETRTKMGFLIEDDEALAHRNRAFVSEFEQWHPRAVDVPHAARMALFQYMIGNADWSQVYFHNVDMVRTWDGRYLPVPYDFDTSGLVDAPYASPDPSLGTRTVRDRVYRGFCYPDGDHGAHRTQLLQLRDSIPGLLDEVPGLGAERREDTMEYLDEFFETLESLRRYSVIVLERCLPIPPP